MRQLAVFSSICICLFFSSSLTARISIHSHKGACKQCHVDGLRKSVAKDILPSTMSRCVVCHGNLKFASHPIGVKLNTVPQGVRVNSRGEIDCLTCHSAHGAEVTTFNRPSCDTCHPDGKGHAGLKIAHFGQVAEQIGDSTLDGSVVLCGSCHDGAVGSNTGSHEPARVIRASAVSGDHPIGSDYPTVSKPGHRFFPIDELPGGIILMNGKVGCLSCHNPYGDASTSYLVMSNRRSALCLTCHDT